MLAELRALAAGNRVTTADDRPRLPRHDHAAGRPAQRPREPGLVHGLHAVPARDLPGPARGAAATSRRSSRTSPGSRWPTPRCSTRRTAAAEAMALARRASKAPDGAAVRGRRRLPSRRPSTSCATRAEATRARRSSSPTSPTAGCPTATASACSCSTPARPGGCGTRPPVIDAAHERGGVAVVAADLLGPVPAPLPRRARRRRRLRHARSASASRSASAARTPATWPCAPGSSARCPAGSSACRSTPTATPPTASPSRPASSTSAGRRRRPTSAPPRCCWP